MAFKTVTKGTLVVKAYVGDMKTLVALNLKDKQSATNLAGFTLQCAPQGQPPYYLQNNLQFEIPSNHAQDPKEPAHSSVNAPIHKFRWLHVPGSVHQGANPAVGNYTYTVTPRYFDGKKSLLPIDVSLSASVQVPVKPFQKQGLEVGFARGYTQSQAFVHRFGPKALIQPKAKTLLFDTKQQSGTDPTTNQPITFEEEYQWLGFTARENIFALLNGVLSDRALHLDMCAYDLNEPDVLNILLRLAAQGRVRILLDNSSLHHGAKSPPEDQFEKLFRKRAKGKAAMLRGKFSRYAHDKVLIVSDGTGPKKVLTGSTNFSVTGLYVNSNHVLVFNDPKVAQTYAGMFEEAWQGHAAKAAFAKSNYGTKSFAMSSAQTPKTEVTFAPHEAPFATSILKDLAARIGQEGTKGKAMGSVLFAVMQIDKGTSPVYTALNSLHNKQNIFSYGISDSPKGIYLYPVGKTTGVLVTGKPSQAILPPPFDQVRYIGGVGHQVHHKFVVCGFNGDDPVVYCGSSNLAEGGEESNGDNLLAIRDGDVATAFALEALALVDHFNFLDRVDKGPKAAKGKPLASKQQAAVSVGWFLSTDDAWTKPYFNPKDLHSVDRQLFA